jgi:hypothetical protein
MSKNYEQSMYQVSEETVKKWAEGKMADKKKSPEEVYEQLLAEYRAYVGDSQAELPEEVMKQVSVHYAG